MSWIKVETHLLNKLEIFELADILSISKKEAAINCILVWSWFDNNSTDGMAKARSAKLLDCLCECEGFVAAMAQVGWIDMRGDSLTITNYDRHNSKSAKNRALGAKRTAKHRAEKAGDSF